MEAAGVCTDDRFALTGLMALLTSLLRFAVTRSAFTVGIHSQSQNEHERRRFKLQTSYCTDAA